MMRLRLFSRDDPSSQIESRLLDEGELTVGRGAKADWVVADPDRALSRLHFTVAMRGGMLTVKDTSTNGIFVGQPRQRTERDRATPVSLGEPILFGPYMLLAEEEQRETSSETDASRASPSPFGNAGETEHDAIVPAKARNPFGSALKSDPIALDEDPGDGDAWERRREYQAGDWNPDAGHRRPDHSEMIGTPQSWTEPPPPAGREHGLGFDAPFTGPILREPAATPAGGLDIPSNWDAPPPAPEPAPVLAPELADAAPALPSQPADPILATSAPKTEAPGQRRAAAAAAAADQALFESFCAGARLSPDAFAGEDRALLMERLGAVYRQSILGVADLMGERTALKNDFRMVRTTIRAEGNNPFKWVPPQRIAVELLRSEDGSGYTTGERALNEALHDVKGHLLCMLAGMRAALGATFDMLAPSEIERRIAGRSFVMPGQKSAAAWSEYSERFAALRREADDSAEGPINRAFREAYDTQSKQLDGRAAR